MDPESKEYFKQINRELSEKNLPRIKGYGSNPPQFLFCRSFAAFIETDLIKNGAARHALDIYDKTFFRENYCVDKILFTYPTKLHTANVLTIKTTGTGNCRGPAGKICTIYGKGL